MKKKIVTFSIIVWAIIAILNPSPAKAERFLLPPEFGGDLTEVVVTQATRNVWTICEAPFMEFDLEQLLAVPGVGMVWAPVVSVFPQKGPTEVTLESPCKIGDSIYYIYQEISNE